MKKPFLTMRITDEQGKQHDYLLNNNLNVHVLDGICENILKEFSNDVLVDFVD